MLASVDAFGPLPSLNGISAQRLFARLVSDKKTVQGNVHFVLTEGIGRPKIVSGVPREHVVSAIEAALGRPASE
jgi:3-dehydroquinate synthase